MLQLYVFVRLDSIRCMDRRINRKALLVCGISLWLLFVVGRELGGHGPGFIPVALDMFSMHWMGSLFVVAVAFLLADLVTGFGLLFKPGVSGIRLTALVVGLLMTVLAHVQGFRAPVVERYDVTMTDLPADLDGLTVATMADFHAGEMWIGAAWLHKRVAQVNRLKPDLVLLAGDLFERSSDPVGCIPAMKKLSAPLGVWAVRGNHDRKRSNRRDVAGEILAGAGIPILENRLEELADGLVLAGVDDLTMVRRRGGDGHARLQAALAERPQGAVILLSHTPLLVEEAAANRVGLMISGHTHNGQIWPFNYLVKQVYPHVSGQSRVGDMTLIVNRGTGTWGPRMRLWKPGEISLITLHAD